MSKPYWIELADRPAVTHADIRAEMRRHEATIEALTWEPEGRPTDGRFRLEVTFLGTPDRSDSSA